MEGNCSIWGSPCSHRGMCKLHRVGTRTQDPTLIHLHCSGIHIPALVVNWITSCFPKCWFWPEAFSFLIFHDWSMLIHDCHCRHPGVDGKPGLPATWHCKLPISPSAGFNSVGGHLWHLHQRCLCSPGSFSRISSQCQVRSTSKPESALYVLVVYVTDFNIKCIFYEKDNCFVGPKWYRYTAYRNAECV